MIPLLAYLGGVHSGLGKIGSGVRNLRVQVELDARGVLGDLGDAEHAGRIGRSAGHGGSVQEGGAHGGDLGRPREGGDGLLRDGVRTALDAVQELVEEVGAGLRGHRDGAPEPGQQAVEQVGGVALGKCGGRGRGE